MSRSFDVFYAAQHIALSVPSLRAVGCKVDADACTRAAVRGGVAACAAFDTVCPLPSFEKIVSVAADEQVFACSSVQGVVSVSCVDPIVFVVSHERVVVVRSHLPAQEGREIERSSVCKFQRLDALLGVRPIFEDDAFREGVAVVRSFDPLPGFVEEGDLEIRTATPQEEIVQSDAFAKHEFVVSCVEFSCALFLGCPLEPPVAVEVICGVSVGLGVEIVDDGAFVAALIEVCIVSVSSLEAVSAAPSCQPVCTVATADSVVACPCVDGGGAGQRCTEGIVSCACEEHFDLVVDDVEVEIVVSFVEGYIDAVSSVPR